MPPHSAFKCKKAAGILTPAAGFLQGSCLIYLAPPVPVAPPQPLLPGFCAGFSSGFAAVFFAFLSFFISFLPLASFSLSALTAPLLPPQPLFPASCCGVLPAPVLPPQPLAPWTLAGTADMPATRLAIPIPARIDLSRSFSMTNPLLEIRVILNHT